jgi:hypothetical protein
LKNTNFGPKSGQITKLTLKNETGSNYNILIELNSSTALQKLIEIRDRLSLIVACFTSLQSYGLRTVDREQMTKAVGKSFGLILGISEICRKFLFDATGIYI